jgi:hypothetical protein
MPTTSYPLMPQPMPPAPRHTGPPAPTLDAAVVEHVLLGGDLSKLSPAQRTGYYHHVCASLGLNPLTRPFEYIVLNGKLQLYARKDCTEQLRRVHGVSISPAGFLREVIEGIFVVTAPAALPSGRTDVSTGAVSIEGLKGEARANAMMKAETKAKRRVTLSICGLGMLDETELETIPDATPAAVDVETGEIQEEAPRLITEAQRKRLFTLASKQGWSTDAIKATLLERFQLDSTRAIPQLQYDQVCGVFSVPPPTADPDKQPF